MKGKEDSQSYQRVKYQVYFAGLILDSIVLCSIFFSGLSFFIKNHSVQVSSNPFIINGMYCMILYLGLSIIHLPLNFFIGYIWEHKYHLSNQKLNQWMVDELKKFIVGAIIVLILIEAIYFLLGQFPHKWWVGAGLFWLFFSFILAKLTPNVIIPLFYRYITIKDNDLKKRIFQLFLSNGVTLKDIFSINLSSKTKKANAFLCGIGKNRQIVLSDTLLSSFTADEIETVVAHELAHYKHKDIFKLLVANALIIFLGFYLINKFLYFAVIHFHLNRIDDIAFLPILLLAFMLFGLLTAPLLNGYSRLLEKQADKFSLETTKKPRDFISMMNKLCEMNLGEFKPNRLKEIFFYDHPPVYKRIELAEKYL